MRRGQKDTPGSMPFYAPPSKYKTSAEIIREARAHIHIGNADSNSGGSGGGTGSGVAGAPRPLSTQRPFTPRDRQRTLFGKAGKPSRPPSAVSLRYLQQQSTDSLMSSTPSVKRVQLSPMPPTLSSSLDEAVFKRLLLDNIDEKPEMAGGVRRKRSEAARRTKSLQLELEQEADNSSGNGAKFKLPCLNGLAKPLHQRKSPGQLKSPFALHSLSEEREEMALGLESAYTPSLSKSEPKTSFSSKERMEGITDVFSGPPPAITLDIFNKRRLFSDFKSKSEDTKVDRTPKQELINVFSNSSAIKDQDYQSSGDYQMKESIRIEHVNTDDTHSARSNTMKIAFQIPAPELNSADVTPRIYKTSFKDYSSKTVEVLKESKVILNRLNDGGPKLFNEEDIILDMKNLYIILEKESSWQDIGRDEKAFMLKTLYKYVDSSNERLLMAIARIVLSLRVTGSNLSGICKLIFKVARNDKNDHLFFTDNTLELFMVGLGSAEPLHDAECLVYGYGALKFLGMSPALLTRMKPIGALPLMALHLKMFNQARLEDPSSVGEQGCHALYQLTGALRNMAGPAEVGSSRGPGSPGRGGGSPHSQGEEGALGEFLNTGAMSELCRTVKLFADDLDVETNVSRTLSVLSADFECCVALCQQKGLLTSVVKLLGRYSDRAPLVVRLNYILGNMVACNDNTRLQLYEESGATDALLNVLEVYLKRCWPGGEFDTAENIIIGSDLDGSSGSDEDVMVKTVRVLANMCMNPSVGGLLCRGPGGGRLQRWLLGCLRAHSPASSPLLLASALATLNNLTFYHGGEGEAFGRLQIDMCTVLCRLLTLEVSQCVTEAVRVLGNMSRSQLIRDYLVDAGALVDITTLLDSDDEETSLAAAGVLVNMAADPSARHAWLLRGGARHAVVALQHAAAQRAWAPAQLLCQALWNAAPLAQADVALLSPLLLNMLDEQQVFGSSENFSITPDEFTSPATKSLEEDVLSSHMAWEEFAAVAVNLLEKIDPTLDSPCDEENREFVFGNSRTMSEPDLERM